MSFHSDIKSIFGSYVNANVTGGIYYELLPINPDLSKHYVSFTFKKGSQVGTMQNKAMHTIYNLEVRLLSKDTSMIESISDSITTYLQSKETTTIVDISFMSDAHEYGEEEKLFACTLYFDVTYST